MIGSIKKYVDRVYNKKGDLFYYDNFETLKKYQLMNLNGVVLQNNNKRGVIMKPRHIISFVFLFLCVCVLSACMETVNEDNNKTHYEVNNNDGLKQTIISNNTILVTNSFLLEIKNCLSTFLVSNRNELVNAGLSISNDTLKRYCLEFGDFWTIGEWTVICTSNVVTASYYRGFGRMDVIYMKSDDKYVLEDWYDIEVDY